MKISDVLSMTIKNLLRRKVRTLLTLLGVLIGTTSITVMMSIGIGMDENMKRELSRMGSLNIITVDPYYFPQNGNQMIVSSSKSNSLDDIAIKKISKINGVEAVCPQMRTYLKFVSGKHMADIDLVGIDTSNMDLFGFNIKEGRLLTSEDNSAVVFGSEVAYMFYNPRSIGGMGGFFGDPGMMGESRPEPAVNVLEDKLILTFDNSYGQKAPVSFGANPDENQPKVKYKSYKVEGAGILKQNWEKDYSAFININFLKKIMKENERAMKQESSRQPGMGDASSQGYQNAWVKVKNINDIEKIQKEINEMGFGAHSLSDIRNQMKKQLFIVQAVLGAIGAISLLVAALGITNTMYMSIYERTREIGIIKVLGCYLSDVRKMFLLESGMIGFIGGVSGILLSFLLSTLLNIFIPGYMNAGQPFPMEEESKMVLSVIPLWLSVFAVSFAVFVGLISGYFPSRRAMRLSALDAIKNE